MDTSTSTTIKGICIQDNTTVNVTLGLTDTTILTNNQAPIYDGSNKATITKVFNNTDNKINCANTYVAQIGNTLYQNFTDSDEDATNDALSVAKTSGGIIELLASETTITSISLDNAITLDGNNNTVKTSKNAITVDYAGDVTFKNIIFEHGATQAAIKINSSANVSITNVQITATLESGYQYGLINITATKGDGDTVTLNMNQVTATMNVTAGSGSTHAIVRVDKSTTKTVDINISNSKLDASTSAKIKGIYIQSGTEVSVFVDLIDTTIKTADVAAIESNSTEVSQTIVMDNACALTSNSQEFANAPISGYDAQIGNTVYLLFKDALAAANEAEDAVTIELLSDVTVTYNYYIGNVNGKTITVEGNDKIVTTAGAKYNHAFRVNKACSVVFKDMTIKHNNRGSVIQVDENTAGATLTLTDVIIQAVNPENTYTDSNDVTYTNIYSYTLINLHSNSTLNMTRVNATMTVATEGWDDYLSILRTGNVNQEKTVEININDCNFNTTGASKRSGIIIMETTNATLNVTDTNISTKDAGAIIDYSGNATITKTFSEKDATKEGYTTYSSADYVAQIGDQMFTSFTDSDEDETNDALSVANATKGNVTIQLLQDISVSQNCYIKNNSTIDGNNHTITTAGGTDSSLDNHALRVNKASCNVEVKNMTIVHKNRGSAIQVDKAGVTLSLTDVIIKADNPDNSAGTYNYALINLLYDSTLNMTRVDIDMKVETVGATDYNQWAIIRTGNSDKEAATYKTIEMNLVDCKLDATEAYVRSGILVVDADATINLEDTSILTQTGDECAAIRGYAANDTDVKKATISMRGNCLLQSGDSTDVNVTIKNIDSGITDGCVWKYKQYNNVTAFRTSEGLEAPSMVPTGYIFAGWYTDKSCTADFALEATDTTTTSAYAKFVPEHVMDVKAQLSKNLLDGISEGEKGAIRFVTTIDSLDYQEVGFDYVIMNSDVELLSGTKKSDVVYRKLYAVDNRNGEPLSLIPRFTFCAESEYFKAVTFKNISSSLFDAEITVRPFWITMDGTKVYGDAVTKTVNQGIHSSDLDGNVNSGSESTKSKYTNRVVLVSDMHYTTSLDKATYDSENWSFMAALASKLPNASYAAGPAFGYTQEQKLQAILDDISSLGANATIDSVMILGDITLDDYGYRNLVNNYLDDFKANFIDKLTYPSYTIAGNHDSYTNTEWKNVIGTDRQYSVVVDNAVFIMLDTFEATHATSASGSAYKGVDIDFLKSELENTEYEDKTIFLCSHYYQEGRNTDNDAALKALIAGDDRIVCMFRGHTHKNTTLTPDSLAGVSLIDIGGYAYNGQKEDDGTYNFNTFDESWAWGYQVLEWNDEEVHLYHVKPARSYTDSDGIVHNYEGAIEDDVVIKIKK